MSLTLIQSGLTVYAVPAWKDAEDPPYRYRLLDAQGEAYPAGAPPSAESHRMEQLPEALSIQWENPATEQWEPPVLLIEIP